MFVSDDLGEDAETDSKAAPAILQGAFDDYESTEKMYESPSDDSQDLGEDDDMNDSDQA